MPEYDVFISYRRDGGDDLSRLLYMSLKQDGYKVFYDVETMRAGKFNEQILESISNSRTVVIVLPPHGLDRCVDPEDWVRLELEFAVSRGKMLIPVMMRGFVWQEDQLPESLKELPNYQGIAANNSLFDSWYAKLKGYIDEQIGRIPGPPKAERQEPAPAEEEDYEWGLIALEDGDFDRAGSIFDGLLKKNVRSARAWLGKALAIEKMEQEAELINSAHPLEENKAFQRALRYADPEMKLRLQGYAESVVNRLDEEAAQEKAAAHRRYLDGFSKGKYVEFGKYPQMLDHMDETPVEWLVLDRTGDSVLLISRYALDAKPYDVQPGCENPADVTWETSTLRSWLNTVFLERAFTPAEREAVQMTEVDNSRSQGRDDWDTSGGNDTRDKVFLLSYTEAWKYFLTDTAITCGATCCAQNEGAYIWPDNGNCWWWLRSPGVRQNEAAAVSSHGLVNEYLVNTSINAVRPALWLDLGKIIHTP